MRGFRTEMCVDSQLWHEDSLELNGSEIRLQAKVCEKAQRVWYRRRQDPEALGQSTAAGRCALLAGGCLL